MASRKVVLPRSVQLTQRAIKKRRAAEQAENDAQERRVQEFLSLHRSQLAKPICELSIKVIMLAFAKYVQRDVELATREELAHFCNGRRESHTLVLFRMTLFDPMQHPYWIVFEGLVESKHPERYITASAANPLEPHEMSCRVLARIVCIDNGNHDLHGLPTNKALLSDTDMMIPCISVLASIVTKSSRNLTQSINSSFGPDELSGIDVDYGTFVHLRQFFYQHLASKMSALATFLNTTKLPLESMVPQELVFHLIISGLMDAKEK